MRPTLVALSLLALCACTEPSESTEPGRQTAVLTGQLTMSPPLALDRPVRLAVLWSPAGPQPVSRPTPGSAGIEVGEAIPAGSFPRDFSLTLVAPWSPTRTSTATAARASPRQGRCPPTASWGRRCLARR